MIDNIHCDVKVYSVALCIVGAGSNCKVRYNSYEYSITKRDQLFGASNASHDIVKHIGTSEVPAAVRKHNTADTDRAQAFTEIEIANEVIESQEVLDRIPVLDCDFCNDRETIWPNKIIQKWDVNRRVNMEAILEYWVPSNWLIEKCGHS